MNGTKIRRILECGIGILPMFSEDHRLEADATMLILVPFASARALRLVSFAAADKYQH